MKFLIVALALMAMFSTASANRLFVQDKAPRRSLGDVVRRFLEEASAGRAEEEQTCISEWVTNSAVNPGNVEITANSIKECGEQCMALGFDRIQVLQGIEYVGKCWCENSHGNPLIGEGAGGYKTCTIVQRVETNTFLQYACPSPIEFESWRAFYNQVDNFPWNVKISEADFPVLMHPGYFGYEVGSVSSLFSQANHDGNGYVTKTELQHERDNLIDWYGTTCHSCPSNEENGNLVEFWQETANLIGQGTWGRQRFVRRVMNNEDRSGISAVPDAQALFASMDLDRNGQLTRNEIQAQRNFVSNFHKGYCYFGCVESKDGLKYTLSLLDYVGNQIEYGKEFDLIQLVDHAYQYQIANPMPQQTFVADITGYNYRRKLDVPTEEEPIPMDVPNFLNVFTTGNRDDYSVYHDGVYVLVGSLSDGSPYYKLSGGEYYLYYIRGCDPSNVDAAWYITDKDPSAGGPCYYSAKMEVETSNNIADSFGQHRWWIERLAGYFEIIISDNSHHAYIQALKPLFDVINVQRDTITQSEVFQTMDEMINTYNHNCAATYGELDWTSLCGEDAMILLDAVDHVQHFMNDDEFMNAGTFTRVMNEYAYTKLEGITEDIAYDAHSEVIHQIYDMINMGEHDIHKSDILGFIHTITIGYEAKCGKLDWQSSYDSTCISEWVTNSVVGDGNVEITANSIKECGEQCMALGFDRIQVLEAREYVGKCWCKNSHGNPLIGDGAVHVIGDGTVGYKTCTIVEIDCAPIEEVYNNARLLWYVYDNMNDDGCDLDSFILIATAVDFDIVPAADGFEGMFNKLAQDNDYFTKEDILHALEYLVDSRTPHCMPINPNEIDYFQESLLIEREEFLNQVYRFADDFPMEPERFKYYARLHGYADTPYLEPEAESNIDIEYFEIPGAFSYDEAQLACAKQSGNLVTIKNDDLPDQLNDICTELCWIGLYSIDTVNWKWANGDNYSTVFQYLDTIGRPNHEDGFCVALDKNQYHMFQKNRCDGSDRAYSAICERYVDRWTLSLTEPVKAPEYVYFEILGHFSYHEAQVACELASANLVTITDAEMNLQMQDICTTNVCWIGLHSKNRAATWEWIYGGSTYRDPVFDGLSKKATDFCVALASSPFPVGWHTDDCDEHIHSALCARVADNERCHSHSDCGDKEYCSKTRFGNACHDLRVCTYEKNPIDGKCPDLPCNVNAGHWCPLGLFCHVSGICKPASWCTDDNSNYDCPRADCHSHEDCSEGYCYSNVDPLGDFGWGGFCDTDNPCHHQVAKNFVCPGSNMEDEDVQAQFQKVDCTCDFDCGWNKYCAKRNNKCERLQLCLSDNPEHVIEALYGICPKFSCERNSHCGTRKFCHIDGTCRHAIECFISPDTAMEGSCPSECVPEENVYYVGAADADLPDQPTIQNSLDDCILNCYSNIECEYSVYRLANKQCWLKKDFAWMELSRTNWVSTFRCNPNQNPYDNNELPSKDVPDMLEMGVEAPDQLYVGIYSLEGFLDDGTSYYKSLTGEQWIYYDQNCMAGAWMLGDIRLSTAYNSLISDNNCIAPLRRHSRSKELSSVLGQISWSFLLGDTYIAVPVTLEKPKNACSSYFAAYMAPSDCLCPAGKVTCVVNRGQSTEGYGCCNGATQYSWHTERTIIETDNSELAPDNDIDQCEDFITGCDLILQHGLCGSVSGCPATCQDPRCKIEKCEIVDAPKLFLTDIFSSNTNGWNYETFRAEYVAKLESIGGTMDTIQEANCYHFFVLADSDNNGWISLLESQAQINEIIKDPFVCVETFFVDHIFDDLFPDTSSVTQLEVERALNELASRR